MDGNNDKPSPYELGYRTVATARAKAKAWIRMTQLEELEECLRSGLEV